MRAYFHEMRGVYKYYAMGGEISMTEFQVLSKDCLFVDKKAMLQAQIDVLFVGVNKDPTAAAVGQCRLTST